MAGPRFMLSHRSLIRIARKASDAIQSDRGRSRLAQRIAESIPPGQGLIVDVESGLGATAAALLARGLAPNRLLLLESDHASAALLAKRYPVSRVVATGLRFLPYALREIGWPPRVSAIITRLDFDTLRDDDAQRAMEALDRCLEPSGTLIQIGHGRAGRIPDAWVQRLGCVEHATNLGSVAPFASRLWCYRKDSHAQWPSLPRASSV